MNTLPVTIHIHSDAGCQQRQMAWRQGWPTPTFGDRFEFRAVEYVVEAVAWRLNQLDELSLEIHLRDSDCDCDEDE